MVANKGFVHLHNHSVYSVLDGVAPVRGMASRARELGMEALALTDHGSLHGVIQFYNACRAEGIKPIIGCELYTCDDTGKREKHTADNPSNYHLVALAKDLVGYRNLMKLSSIGHVDGFYYKPRVDRKALREHSKGLIVTSGCLSGEIAFLLKKERMEDADRLAGEYLKLFGEGNFYLEVMDNGIPEQAIVNKGLIEIANRRGIPLVATNDCHYILPGDSEKHDILLCIQTGKLETDSDRMRMTTNQFYMKSPQEMAKAFSHVPEALSNTLDVAERCNVELKFEGYHMPRFTVPEGEEDPGDLKEFFHRLVWRGAKERYGDPLPAEIKERAEYEMSVIEKMGFESYFLIVWDYIRFARENVISVGPGRGSAAGSIVSYCMRITDVDPLKYGLLFERFLNPERISMPDIDTDFSDKRRDEVIQYVTRRYGEKNVAQIGTFGTLKARSAIRDVARVMGFSPSEADQVAKKVPEGLDVTIEDALQSLEFREIANRDARYRKLVDTASALEGAVRQTGVHAAGVVIGEDDLTNFVPLMRPQKGAICTQFGMNDIEKIGLVKMDFLGLKTLSVIDAAIDNVRAAGGDVDWDKISMDDPETYELLSAARTTGVFQLESRGMRDILKKLEPGRFNDLVPILGLYRPGPLGSGLVDDFIKRRHRPETVRYDHPVLEPILKETYGIIVYQEQAMRIAADLSGFTMGQADVMRKAMGKKNPETMAKCEADFIDGAVARGADKKTAQKIWDNIKQFAGYGFNKSHTVAYAFLSFRTAYLKARHPKEFMAAALTNDMGDNDKIAKFVADCASIGIGVLPPDVNESQEGFAVAGKGIRFGLGGIKNLGHNAVSEIIRARRESGPYKNLMDFCERLDQSAVNARAIETLIRAGAFDSLGHNRASLLAGYEKAIRLTSSIHRDRSVGQLNMFDAIADEHEIDFELEDRPELPESELLRGEKELLGIYVTGHPLSRHAEDLELLSTSPIASLVERDDLENLRLAGSVQSVRRRTTKGGNVMAFVMIEDLTGSVEVVVFPSLLEEAEPILQENNLIVVVGTGEQRRGQVSIRADAILPLDKAWEKFVDRVTVRLYSTGLEESYLQQIKEVVNKLKGGSQLRFILDTPGQRRLTVEASNEFSVRPCPEFRRAMEDLFEENVVSFHVRGKSRYARKGGQA